MFVVAMLVAACMACSSKKPVQKTVPVASCVGDPKYEQVKITIEHDKTGAASSFGDIPPVTIYLNPDVSQPTHRGKVCWVIEPVTSDGNPTPLLTSLILSSKDGTPAFEKWTTKQKMPGDPLYIPSGVPNKKIPSPGWGYGLKYGGISVDPVIIIIDDSH
jgi:hypothetical protein